MPSSLFRPTGKQWNPNFPNSATELNQNRSVLPIVWTLSDEPGDDENLMRFVVRKEPGTTVRVEVPGALEASSALITGSATISGDLSVTSLTITSTATVGSLNVATLQTYDTGWVANSDWTNVDLVVTHNLNTPLVDLVVKFFISDDGTDAGAFLPMQGSGGDNYGFAIFQQNLNTIIIRTSLNGVYVPFSLGAGLQPINNESWFYQVKVYRLT